MKNIKYLIAHCSLLIAATIVYFLGAMTDVIDVDSAQYAAISMELLQSGNFLEVYERGIDYLDKPPLIFWISSFSFSFFGYSNLAFKLPAVLISCFGMYAIFRLASHLHNKEVGRNAVFILASSLGFIWANMDVKTDVYLTAFVIFSIWQFILFIDEKRIKHLLFGAIGVGLALLAKGPLALVVVGFALGGHLLLHRNWRAIVNPKWLIALPIIALVLLPMCYGLYQQFDLQPEKIVNGKTGVSGLRFFFWEQSFGRITGENSWKNNTSFFYLFHTAFVLALPWAFLLLGALYQKAKQLFTRSLQGEFYTFFGILLTLIALSFSSYKIPHYVLVFFPLIAILTGQYVVQLEQEKSKMLKWNTLFFAVLTVLGTVLASLIFVPTLWTIVLLIALFVGCFLTLKTSGFYSIKPLIIIGLVWGILLNAHIIPALENYQEGRRFATIINENNLPKDDIYFFNRTSRAVEFYTEQRYPELSGKTVVQRIKEGKKGWYYMSEDGKVALENAGFKRKEEYTLPIYDLNRISGRFLHPNTRKKEVRNYYLIFFEK